MLNCRDATRLLSESLDHPLPWRRRMGLWMHVSMCKYCSRFGKQIAWLRRFMRRYPQTAEQQLATEKLSSEARQRIVERLTRDES